MCGLLLACVLCLESFELPLVEEEVDEIALVYRPGEDSYPQVVFIKDGKQLAWRGHSDTMMLVVVEDRFGLLWEDYWNCQRVVWAKRIGVYEIEPLKIEDDGVWWQMGRPMRDLKAP